METNIFKDCVGKNWKQNNALAAIFRDWGRDYSKQRNNPHAGHCNTIKQLINEVASKEPFGSDYFYFDFDNQPHLGKVLKYENARLSSVHVNHDHVVFNIKFDVENPHIEEINRLKNELKAFDGLNNLEFSKRITEWEGLYTKMRNLDAFIASFTYAYAYDLPDGKLLEIIEAMRKPGAKEYAMEAIRKQTLQRKLCNSVQGMTYDQKVKYWDLWDEVNDLASGDKPTAEILEHRRKRRETSEADYAKNQENIKKLMKEL